MSTEISKQNQLPTIAELTSDLELAYKNDQLNLLLNQEPPKKWVKKHYLNIKIR